VSTPDNSVLYVDSLFLIVSTTSLTGLNTVNLDDLNTCQQVFLYTLTILGNPISVSIFVVYMRKEAFLEKFIARIEATISSTPGKPSVLEHLLLTIKFVQDTARYRVEVTFFLIRTTNISTYTRSSSSDFWKFLGISSLR